MTCLSKHNSVRSAKLYFEGGVIFLISRSEITRMSVSQNIIRREAPNYILRETSFPDFAKQNQEKTSPSKEYFATAGGEIFFIQPQIKCFAAKPRVPLANSNQIFHKPKLCINIWLNALFSKKILSKINLRIFIRNHARTDFLTVGR